MNKKLLYESIMKDVAKIVKKHLNESVDDITLAQMVLQGLDDGSLEIIGKAYGKPVISVNDAFDYIQNNFYDAWDDDFEYISDDIYNDLLDINTKKFCIYDPDVLWQLSTGSDGIANDEGWKPEDFVIYDGY